MGPHSIGRVSAISFSGAALDRAPALRHDPRWVAERLADAGSEALLLTEAGAWAVRGDVGTRLARVAAAAVAEEEPVLLGLDEGRALFAADVGDRDGLPGELLDMRTLATELPARETGLAAYAAALLNWHRRHRFCSVCGQPSEPVDAGHERRCSACGASHFPRTDPVVIMRVLRDERILLGHQAAWPTGRYSVLAGFVEPGETLEQAVRREVWEEAGLALDGVGYVASQPWPFPSSLMLGFEAQAVDEGEPEADGKELAHVRWFRRDEVRAAANGESDVRLPPGLSISRRLIDGWLAGGR
jgi:NAD+ diphosphatase